MKKSVLLDLDGTLTDPYPGISRCIVYALDKLGAPAPSAEALKGWIGPPLKASFAAWLKLCESTADADRALVLYRERFSEKGLFENEVYPGIPRLLSDLADTGADIFLATSKPRVYAKQILEHFELDRFFSAIHGSELDGRNSDKYDLLAMIMATEHLSARSCIMVGDRHHDIDAARTHGITSVGVLWGYGGKTELQEAGADAITATVEQLKRIIVEAYSG